MGINGKDKQEFITNFAIELTNRTLDEREQIAEKYYNIIQRLKAENEIMKKWRQNSINVIKKLSEKLKQYIRAFNRHSEKIYELEKEIKTLNAANVRQTKTANELGKQMLLYKMALEKIKQIINQPIMSSCFASSKFALGKIQNIIDEVLNDD